MKRRCWVLALISVFPAVALGSDGLGVAHWCECLSDPPLEFNGARDGSPVVSVLVPSTFVRAEGSKGDSHNITWTSAGVLSLGVNSETSDLISGRDFGALAPNECIAHINQSRVLVSLSSTAASMSLNAEFEALKHSENHVSLRATAESPEKLCELGRSLLWSAIPINNWQSLKVRLVAADRLSFAYTNEIGEIRAAKVGHIISRDFGRVTAINETAVTIVELIANGLGGYNEVERKIPFVALSREG